MSGCLKLLLPEELGRLDFPKDTDSSSQIKKLVYIIETDRTNKEEKLNLSEGLQDLIYSPETRLLNRENKILSEKGGFRISDEDKRYMETCKAVISTCAFGGGDDLYQPIGMTETSLQMVVTLYVKACGRKHFIAFVYGINLVKVCYVAFWDEITLVTQEAQGTKVNENHFIGKWRVIIVKDLPFRDQRLNGKIPKVCELSKWNETTHNS